MCPSRSHRRADLALLWLFRLAAGVAGGVVVLIVGFLLLEAMPALREIGPARFLTDASWHPTEGRYDLVPMLVGTLLAAAGGVALAAPLGIGSAIFCHFVAPAAVARLYRRLVELLAGIPSVVYGFWGLVVLVPAIARLQPPGPSLLAGVLVLAIMILPTMALAADAALAAVPGQLIQGAAALGMTPWATLRHVVLPAARRGLLTGGILQTGRALGETMAVLMVCGNVVQTPRSPFEPVRTLTANIALEMAYALSLHRSALFVSGLVLMAIVGGLVVVAELLDRSRVHG